MLPFQDSSNMCCISSRIIDSLAASSDGLPKIVNLLAEAGEIVHAKEVDMPPCVATHPSLHVVAPRGPAFINDVLIGPQSFKTRRVTLTHTFFIRRSTDLWLPLLRLLPAALDVPDIVAYRC